MEAQTCQPSTQKAEGTLGYLVSSSPQYGLMARPCLRKIKRKKRKRREEMEEEDMEEEEEEEMEEEEEKRRGRKRGRRKRRRRRHSLFCRSSLCHIKQHQIPHSLPSVITLDVSFQRLHRFEYKFVSINEI
jgi:hypothetical protein